MIKIAHIGDIHLDSPLTSLRDIQMSAERRKETAETFFSAVDKCAEQKVELVLLAGDIFDSEYISLANCKRVARKMEEKKELRFFIAPGNHDFLHPASVYRQVEWPSNVHIFSQKNMTKVVLPEKRVCVWGAAFTSPTVENSLLAGFKVEDPAWTNIGVLHGEITGAASGYNPLSEEQIGKSRLDYLALGHLHAFSGILKARQTFYAYAGCLEPRGFDEPGQKGFIIAEIDKEESRFYFYPAAKRQYLEVAVDITGIGGAQEISAAIREKLEEGQKHLYKIRLTGQVAESEPIHTEDIADRLKADCYYCKVIDETQIAREFFEIARERTLTGIFVAEILEKIRRAQTPQEKEKWERALHMGYQALSGREVAPL